MWHERHETSTDLDARRECGGCWCRWRTLVRDCWLHAARVLADHRVLGARPHSWHCVQHGQFKDLPLAVGGGPGGWEE